VALVFIDLDHFKRANDTLGHAAGDDLLREGGRIVQASIRGSDIAARMGGDEFVVLLPETAAGDASELGRRIGSALDAAPTFRHAGVSASVGVVADPSASRSLSDLLEQADAQMYQAKRAGRRSRAAPVDPAARGEADLVDPPAALTTPGCGTDGGRPGDP
jgi:diguanylate cyclase (GGDEF)-like protein